MICFGDDMLLVVSNKTLLIYTLNMVCSFSYWISTKIYPVCFWLNLERWVGKIPKKFMLGKVTEKKESCREEVTKKKSCCWELHSSREFPAVFLVLVESPFPWLSLQLEKGTSFSFQADIFYVQQPHQRYWLPNTVIASDMPFKNFNYLLHLTSFGF